MPEISRAHELIDQGLVYAENSRISGETSAESLSNAQGHIEDATNALAIALESLEKASAEFRTASNKSAGARENFNAARRKFTEAAGEDNQSSSVQELLYNMQPNELGADLDLVVNSSRNGHSTVNNILQKALLQQALDLTRGMLVETALPLVVERAQVYASNNVHYVRATATAWRNTI